MYEQYECETRDGERAKAGPVKIECGQHNYSIYTTLVATKKPYQFRVFIVWVRSAPRSDASFYKMRHCNMYTQSDDECARADGASKDRPNLESGSLESGSEESRRHMVPRATATVTKCRKTRLFLHLCLPTVTSRHFP